MHARLVAAVLVGLACLLSANAEAWADEAHLLHVYQLLWSAHGVEVASVPYLAHGDRRDPMAAIRFTCDSNFVVGPGGPRNCNALADLRVKVREVTGAKAAGNIPTIHVDLSRVDPELLELVGGRAKLIELTRDCVLANAVKEAVGEMFGRVRRLSSARDLPPVFFFALFSFTNLSALALAVEEALFDPASEQVFTVRRQEKYVRRTELIVASDGREPS